MHNSNRNLLMTFWCKIFLLISIIILIAGIFNSITDVYYMWRHYGAYSDKLDRIKNIEGERTIFIGGSSVLLGVNAEHYTELSGQTAINMGLNALRSPDIYFNCIEPYINKGDKIVIALEHHAYSSIDEWREYDDVGLDVAHLSGEYYKVIPKNNILQYYYQQTLRSFRKISERAFWSSIEKYSNATEKVYLRENINKYGDMMPDFAIETQYPRTVSPDFTIDEKVFEEIKKYVNRFQDKGAAVYIIFPPSYTVDADKRDIDIYYDEFVDTFGNIVLGKPDDWMLEDATMFYDTGYHLIRSEALLHTEYIYDLIQSGEQ